jgi:hypothetical protein
LSEDNNGFKEDKPRKCTTNLGDSFL